jgi:putative ABC transport system permease protein
MTAFLGALQQGLMYGLLAMGIFISFRILNIPDLTAEGSFTLGVAVSATVTVAGAPYPGCCIPGWASIPFWRAS